jgi:hypothetical protein
VDLLAAWLLYPLALAVICLGLALLVERLSAWRAPGALLVPIGLMTLLVLVRLITAQEATARAALPVIGVLALAGLVLGRGRLRALRPDPWLLAAVVALYAVLAAPVVLSGEATFAGYLALPDTNHQLALADLFAHRGPDWQGLPDGANSRTMARYVTSSYPVAAQAALGVTAPLGALDIAWLYQPFLAFTLLALALAIWALSAPLLGRRWQAAVVTFTASQSALVIGNYLTGAIKEITAVAVLLTLAALVTAAAQAERRSLRALLPVALAAAAALGVLGPAALAYVAVPALVVVAVWGYPHLRRPRMIELGGFAIALAVLGLLALPILRNLKNAIRVNEAVLVDLKAELGHLAAPLDTAQALGIWLSGDFRYPASPEVPQTILLVIAGFCAIAGVVWAIRRRRWGPLLVVAMLVPTSLLLLARGTAYADSKVLMIVSPGLLLLALLGAMALWTGRWRALSAVLAAALVAGVMWSSALAYHDVSLAPHDRYSELLELNDELAGRGPAFFSEYDEFSEYFLRDVPIYSSPYYPHQFRSEPYEPNALRDPRRRPSEKTPIDIDDVTLDYIESVPYAIMRRGPQRSRPPANFRRVSSGTYYDVWRRSSRLRVLDHMPLGPDVLHQAARVSEPVARRWAARARARGGRIAYVERERPPVFLATRGPRPILWIGFGNFPEALLTEGPANIMREMRIPRTGRYSVWVEGSFERAITIGVDGRPLPMRPDGLNNPGAYASLGTVALTRGRHELSIRQFGGTLSPGSGGYLSSLRHIGPIFFDPVANERDAVREIEPGAWRSLIGVRADWLEIVRR